MTEHEIAADQANAALLGACKAMLLFYHSGPWTPELMDQWYNLINRTDVTIKALCDVVRDAIAEAEGEQEG